MDDLALHARHGEEYLAGEMAGGAGAGGGHAKLARIGLHQGDELLHVLCRQRQIDREQRRAHDEAADGRQILLAVERDLLDMRQQRQRAGAAIDDGVAVGRRMDALLDAGLAEQVLDLDRLPEHLRHALCDDARLDVGCRTHHLRRDEPDRLRRIVLGGSDGRVRGERGAGKRDGGEERVIHVSRSRFVGGENPGKIALPKWAKASDVRP
jgi:hypothetical protein